MRDTCAPGENPLSGHRAVSFSYYPTPAASGGHGMSGGGPFGCDDLQAIMNRQIADQFPKQMGS